MPKVKIAHIREQGADLIIVPFDIEFGDRNPDAQQSAIDELQRMARQAGLAGDVVPVWDSGGGFMSYIAPANHHGYLNTINLQMVYRNLNRELSW